MGKKAGNTDSKGRHVCDREKVVSEKTLDGVTHIDYYCSVCLKWQGSDTRG